MVAVSAYAPQVGWFFTGMDILVLQSMSLAIGATTYTSDLMLGFLYNRLFRYLAANYCLVMAVN